MSRMHRNHNYIIITETLSDGRVRASARGRIRKVRTFDADVPHADAAQFLADLIEGRYCKARWVWERFSNETTSEWAVFAEGE